MELVGLTANRATMGWPVEMPSAWLEVINGVVAVPLMAIIMLMAMRPDVMGRFVTTAGAVGDGVVVHGDDGGRGGDHVCHLVSMAIEGWGLMTAPAKWQVGRIRGW